MTHGRRMRRGYVHSFERTLCMRHAGLHVAVTACSPVAAQPPAVNPMKFCALGAKFLPVNTSRSRKILAFRQICHGMAVAPRRRFTTEVVMQMAIDSDVSRKRAGKRLTHGPDVGNGPRGETSSETANPRSGASAGQVVRGLGRRLSQMREANEHLVVAAVRAQTLSDEAETASHLKDEFLAMVSHEIRTPLGAVLGWARILASKQMPPDAEPAIAAIGRNATALAHMIDDLLDTSRILNGAIRLAFAPVDLAAVAQAALDAVRPSAATKNVRLAFDDVPGSRLVRGDAERLEQVIWNLLTNAIKFTPEGGRVDVFIESTADHVEVRVVDTGQGIHPELLPHVFERFR